MLLSKVTHIIRYGCVVEFQSLFFWMLLSKVIMSVSIVGAWLFQSLFFWMLLSKMAANERCGGDLK